MKTWSPTIPTEEGLYTVLHRGQWKVINIRETSEGLAFGMGSSFTPVKEMKGAWFIGPHPELPEKALTVMGHRQWEEKNSMHPTWIKVLVSGALIDFIQWRFLANAETEKKKLQEFCKLRKIPFTDTASRYWWKRKQDRWRDKQRESGKCITCGEETDDRLYCEKHAEAERVRNRGRMRDTRAKRKA